MDHAKPPGAALPCVVQVGFSGSRHLWDDSGCSAAQLAAWEEAVVQHLARRLAEIELPDNHFLVGVSQIACGGDTLFSRACAAPTAPIPQRIFLPQHRADFLSAVDSNNKPDFSTAERAEAETVLDSERVIQELIVSHAASRSARFEETNLAILRESDLVVCLIRSDAAGSAGGARHFLERAKLRGTPALEIQVQVTNGTLEFKEVWHPADGCEQYGRNPPSLPQELQGVEFQPLPRFPSVEKFCNTIKEGASVAAAGHKRRFRTSAAWIIFAHILATIFASAALALHHFRERFVFVEALIIAFLAVEIGLLVWGLWWHNYLHRRHAARLWAVSRVVAELGRSVQAIGARHVHLQHLFLLQLPHRFRYLFRTLNVLHLRSTRAGRNAPWETNRDNYLKARFDDLDNGQIPFYQNRLAEEERSLRWCQRLFTVCSCSAIIVTFVKLVLVATSMTKKLRGEPDPLEYWNDTVPPFLGTFAIVLPVLAVGGLSWSAALDLSARVETFRETLEFLQRQRPLIENAASGDEFDNLLGETEFVLLSETAGWFARRSNTSVA